MKIAVVDDEQYWREKTIYLLKQYLLKEDDIIDEYENGENYVKNETKYDISFVDIEMPGIDGFDTIKQARHYNNEGLYIILTTHTEMSRKGYLVEAFRYIDKTNMNEEIKEALDVARLLLKRNTRIAVNVVGYGERQVTLKDIIYIETEKHNIIIHTTSGVLKCNNRLSELEEELDEEWFFRCHNSYIVNLDMVKRVKKTILILLNGDSIEVSQRKISVFNRMYLKRQYRCGNA